MDILSSLELRFKDERSILRRAVGKGRVFNHFHAILILGNEHLG